MGLVIYFSPNWQYIPLMYHLYTAYILPIGWLYATYHLLREPGNSIDLKRKNEWIWLWIDGCLNDFCFQVCLFEGVIAQLLFMAQKTIYCYILLGSWNSLKWTYHYTKLTWRTSLEVEVQVILRSLRITAPCKDDGFGCVCFAAFF